MNRVRVTGGAGSHPLPSDGPRHRRPDIRELLKA
jgi:hypothetical protein